MIHVDRVQEPPDFDKQARQPGRKWMAEHPEADRPRDYWSPFKPALAAGFRNLCGYSALHTPVGTVDHYVSCREDATLAYEWSNYRFAAIFIFFFHLILLYNVNRYLKIKTLKLKEEREDQMSKIYIIDDDQDIVESISMVLKANGYDVAAQYNDEDVIENVSEYSPDLIILDVIFPEDSSAGFKIARALKSDDKLVKIPIIMLSAVNEKGIYMGKFSDQDIDQSWLPVNKFLDKPVQPKDLLQLVESVLKGK